MYVEVTISMGFERKDPDRVGPFPSSKARVEWIRDFFGVIGNTRYGALIVEKEKLDSVRDIQPPLEYLWKYQFSNSNGNLIP